MEGTFATAALWIALALASTFLAAGVRVSTALVEIIVGVAAAALVGQFFSPAALGAPSLAHVPGQHRIGRAYLSCGCGSRSGRAAIEVERSWRGRSGLRGDARVRIQ